MDEWLSLFDDPILSNRAPDRLANASYQMIIDGTSYRGRLSLHRTLLGKGVISDNKNAGRATNRATVAITFAADRQHPCGYVHRTSEQNFRGRREPLTARVVTATAVTGDTRWSQASDVGRS